VDSENTVYNNIDEKQLRNLKLIVFDIDGTLVNRNDEIGDDTIKLVRELGENYDMKFSFASGRQHGSLIKHAETLDIRSPLISLDGTLIKGHPGQEKIFVSLIPKKYVEKAVTIADKYLLKIALCHDEAIYYDENNAGVQALLEKYGAEYQEVKSYENYLRQTLEIVITGEDKNYIRYINKKMKFPYSFGLKTSYYKSHFHSDIYYLEIRKNGCSKGTGLKKLAKYLNVKISETAVAGDWYNDLSLFDTGAYKVAMSNSIPELIRKADFVTKKNSDEDGIAEFLSIVLKAKQNKII